MECVTLLTKIIREIEEYRRKYGVFPRAVLVPGDIRGDHMDNFAVNDVPIWWGGSEIRAVGQPPSTECSAQSSEHSLH